MDGFDIAAFAVIVLLAAIAVGVFVFLGGWPGRTARRLDHPYAEAISIGGWVTLIFGGVGFPFILIWAYAPPGGSGKPNASEPVPESDLEEGQKS